MRSISRRRMGCESEGIGPSEDGLYEALCLKYVFKGSFPGLGHFHYRNIYISPTFSFLMKNIAIEGLIQRVIYKVLTIENEG